MGADPTRPNDITEDAWALIQTAKAVALSQAADEVHTQHLFRAVAVRDGDLMKVALAAQGIGQTEIERCIDRVKPTGKLPDPSGERRRLSSAAQEAVDRAKRLAGEYPVADLTQVAPVHLWVGLCADIDELTKWLVDCGWPEESVRRLPEVAQKQLPQRRGPDAGLKEGAARVLSRFCHRNLTELARQGRLTVAYGMEEPREQLVHCLLKRNKPSVVLTGPAGVGKTKLVEDLALRAAKHEIPELDACEVFELDLALFTRGTHLVGSRAERWTQLTKVLREHPEQVILFIDELHTIVGLPIEGQQAMDMSNALKPLLVDSKVRIIGATTPDEYRRYIEGDQALARRFAEIKIPEPDRNTMLDILRAIATEYEVHHGVRYSGESLEAIYDLAHACIPGQSFPAKAVDLLDEVGVRAKMKSRQAQAVSRQVPPLVQSQDVKETLKRIWGVEPESLSVDIAELLTERVVGQEHAARKLSDVIITSAFRYGKEDRREPRAIILFLGPPGVGKSYMAQTLSDILFPGRDRLLTLDMTEFSGLHAGEHARFRLLGPPPPYVGWETGGLLTGHALQHPVSVVLIDEFEKASPEARNVLLRIFNEGSAQDGRGRIVTFRGIYFILTANAGHTLWQRARQIGFGPQDGVGFVADAPNYSEEKLRQVLREEGFASELLSRISHVVMFDQLSEDHLRGIARLKLERLREAALLEDLVLIKYDEDGLVGWLVDQCMPQLDCRRLTAIFETLVETPLARWRLQKGPDAAALTLVPAGTSLQLVAQDKSEVQGALELVLLERVAAVFSRRQRTERDQHAARTRFGASR